VDDVQVGGSLDPQPSQQAGMPATFLGYAVAEAEDMPAVAANAFPVAFGNFFAGYTIVDMGPSVVIRDPYTNKPYTMFYSTKRVGGDLVDSEAIKLLKVATA
jgi:HK97 family phage major capsid protein